MNHPPFGNPGMPRSGTTSRNEHYKTHIVFFHSSLHVNDILEFVQEPMVNLSQLVQSINCELPALQCCCQHKYALVGRINQLLNKNRLVMLTSLQNS